jgi:hypothetical protein
MSDNLEEPVMENWNIVEILKVGLPGLVFLLSMLSFRLLSKEQEKNAPSEGILSSIKIFMCINVALAVLTLASPIIDGVIKDGIKEGIAEEGFKIQASMAVAKLEQGNAQVCLDAGYKNMFLLVGDSTTGKVVQVFAGSPMPCNDEKQIRLTEKDLNQLGWSGGTTSRVVDVFVAKPGYKFATF